MRLLIFWDSISEWFYDYDKWGWVNRLKLVLWKKDIDVANCWISAYTTKNVLNMFDSFFNAYSNREPWKEKETVILFSIWINDSCTQNWENMISKEDFKNNLEKLYILSKEKLNVKNIFFLTCINCDENKTLPTSWWEYYYKNFDIQKYNEIIKDLCKEKWLEYLDLYGILENTDLLDWLHPNSNWHQKIFKKVLEFLKLKLF